MFKELFGTNHEKCIDKNLFAENSLEARKMARIKKKLMSLEVERCQQKMAHRDLSHIDKKIAKQKSEFTKFCKHD